MSLPWVHRELHARPKSSFIIDQAEVNEQQNPRLKMKTTLLLVVLSCLLAAAPISAERHLRTADETRLDPAPFPGDALKVAIEKFKNKHESKPESRRLTGERAMDKFVKAIAVLKEKDQARRVEERGTN